VKVSITMKVAVHPVVAKLWLAMEKGELKPGMSLREIGKIIGEQHPQKIQHHLESMRKMGTISWKDGMYLF